MAALQTRFAKPWRRQSRYHLHESKWCCCGQEEMLLTKVVCEAMAAQPTEPFHYMIWGRNTGDARPGLVCVCVFCSGG